MSKLAAIITGLALASILVAAASVRQGLRAGEEARPSKPAVEARQVDMPVPPKADRLPLPEHQMPSEASGALKNNRAPDGWRASDEHPPPLRADPIPIAVAQLNPPAHRADPVCGPRGRTWYTKDNGYRYWKCIR